MTLFELSKDQVKELREALAYGHHVPFTTNPDDITDEMLIEIYGDTNFSNDDFMAKPRECADNYCVGNGNVEVETCPECGREVTFHWNICEDGFKAYCPHCGEWTLLCDACRHRFSADPVEEWQDCRKCPFMETGFAEDDAYVWEK